MKRFAILLAGTIGAVSVFAALSAQVFTNPVQLVDVQSRGTKLNIFGQKNLHYWNFQGGALYNADAGAMEISPFAGTFQTRPTCDVNHRNEIYTENESTDAAVTDVASICLMKSDGTFSWKQFATLP